MKKNSHAALGLPTARWPPAARRGRMERFVIGAERRDYKHNAEGGGIKWRQIKR